LAYHLPAVRSAICAGVSVAWPSAGFIASGIGTTTPALAPGNAGPWKWAADAGPVSPE